MWGESEASVVGTAFVNPDGSIGLGLSIVASPEGLARPAHARIDLASLGGSWRDSAGNTGAFVFTPGSGTGGPPRPAGSTGIAAGSITSTHLATNAVGGAQANLSQLQARVTGMCPAGQSIRGINPDGRPGVSGGSKLDSCGGRKSDGRQHGQAAG